MHVVPIKYLSRADPRLGVVIKTVGKYSIKLRTDAFQSLVEAIIYQQLAGVAANVIYTRFMKYYNNMMPMPMDIVSTSDMELRSKVGLSTKKVIYLKDLATKIEEQKLKLDLLPTLSDEEVINQLIQVKGIGRWTAEMFLIFCLERKDVFPLKDLGIKKAIQRWYFNPEYPDEQSIIDLSNIWKPYRSIASWYLWKSLSNFDTI